MVQVGLSTSTTFDGDLNALVEDQGTDITFRIDLDEAAPAGGTRVYIDSDTVQIFNRLDLPAAQGNPRIENINLFSVSTNVDDSGLAFTIDPGATFATITLAIFDNDEPDTFLPETFDGRVDAEFFVRTASEVSTEDAAAITGISDYTVDSNAASSVVIFVDNASQLPGETTNNPTVGITLDKSDVVEGESITLTINVDGEIPSEGLRVFINDTANAQSSMTRSLTEFDVGNVQLTGINGFPEPAQGDSGFFVTVTAPTATVTLPVLDDGIDEDELDEVFTFEVIDEDAYEVDANASSVTISITDNEVAVNPRSSDFEDGTVQGWTVGQPGNHFAPPTNIPSGGPDGAEDNYLRAQSQGGGGVGSRLVWFNQSADWRGNYIEDGTTSIKASLINEGSEDVVIRVGFDGPGGRFVTTEGVTLTPGSGWQEATFNIEPEDLTAVGGSNVEATLSNVSQIRFLNNATPSYQGAAVAAQVGVDDITFMTEPPTNSVPVLSLTATPETLNEAEGTIITYNFSIDGEIPEGGLTFRSDDLFDAELNWRAFDFDNPSPDELSGLELIDFERVVDDRGNATFVVIWNMTEPEGFLKLAVLDDEVADAPSTFTVGLVAGEGYELNPDASEVTVEIIDGIVNTGGPTISMAVSDTEVNEGDPFTVTFTAEGELPEGGQDIFVLSDVQNALGEFITVDENGNPLITTEGISNIEPTFRGFIATMVENTATISFDVFDDGPGEGPETFTYSLLDGENYDIDSDSSTFAITVDDSETTSSPIVSFSIEPDVVSEEGEPASFTGTFTVDGEIPTPEFDAEGNLVSGGLSILFDNTPNAIFAETEGNPIIDGFIFGDYFDPETNRLEFILLENTSTFTLNILNDIIQEEDESFTFTVFNDDAGVLDSNYVVNPEASSDTVTLTDGVEYGDTTVGISVSETELTEGDELTLNFDVDGDIPASGLQVVVQSPTTGALGEFAIFDENGNFNIESQGIARNPEAYDGQGSSFLVTLTDTSASITLPVFNDGIGEGTETINFALVDGERYNADAANNQVALTIEETPVEVKFEANANGEVSKFAYDLTGAGAMSVTATVDQEALDITDADFDNYVGFYETVDENGGIDTDGDGVADFNPGDEGYAKAALENAVDGMTLRLGGNPNDDTTAGSFGDTVIQGGTFYAPFAIANAGDMTVADFLAANPDNDAATSIDDQVAYFAFGEANPDGAIHLQSRDNGIYGFEDLPSNLGVSDNDFNDAVFKFNFTA